MGGSVVQMCAGSSHNCVVTTTGSVVCWGLNGNGQLGLGHVNNIGDDETPADAGPVPLGGTAVAVACGQYHTCALLTTASVRCWGYGYYGQLGGCKARQLHVSQTR